MGHCEQRWVVTNETLLSHYHDVNLKIQPIFYKDVVIEYITVFLCTGTTKAMMFELTNYDDEEVFI